MTIEVSVWLMGGSCPLPTTNPSEPIYSFCHARSETWSDVIGSTSIGVLCSLCRLWWHKHRLESCWRLMSIVCKVEAMMITVYCSVSCLVADLIDWILRTYWQSASLCWKVVLTWCEWLLFLLIVLYTFERLLSSSFMYFEGWYDASERLGSNKGCCFSYWDQMFGLVDGLTLHRLKDHQVLQWFNGYVIR